MKTKIKGKVTFKKVYVITSIIIACAALLHLSLEERADASAPLVVEFPVQRESDGGGRTVNGPCTEVAPYVHDCTDQATRDIIYRETEGGTKAIDWHGSVEVTPPTTTWSKTMVASVSMYSRKDSCHNRRGKVCLTAIGKDTKAGTTVACPRSMALGTKLIIKSGPLQGFYVCEDRTAKWVEQKFGPTIDVFTEDYAYALTFGRHATEVAIVK